MCIRDRSYAARVANIGPDLMRMVEKSLLLQIFDAVWKEHLLALDHLRQGIGLRAYGQRDPLNEYKSEAFNLFNGMTKWGSLSIAALMVLLVVWFCTPAGFLAGFISAAVLTVLGVLFLREKPDAAH